MKVSHFGGTQHCDTLEKLDFVLNSRFGDGVNEFWISGETETPCLTMLVNNSYASLTYFPDDEHPGYQSVGKDCDLDLCEITVFFTNSPQEELEINNDAVIPLSLAITAAKEFFVNFKIPSCVEWSEM